jgi:hypothetical protein
MKNQRVTKTTKKFDRDLICPWEGVHSTGWHMKKFETFFSRITVGMLNNTNGKIPIFPRIL